MTIRPIEFFIVCAVCAFPAIQGYRTGRMWVRGNLAESTTRDSTPIRFRLFQGGLVAMAVVMGTLGIAELAGLIGPEFKL